MITVLPLGVTTTVWAERVAKTGSSSPSARMIFHRLFRKFPGEETVRPSHAGNVWRDAETDADGFIFVLGNRHASYVVNDTAMRELHQTPDGDECLVIIPCKD